MDSSEDSTPPTPGGGIAPLAQLKAAPVEETAHYAAEEGHAATDK